MVKEYLSLPKTTIKIVVKIPYNQGMAIKH